MLFNKKNNLSRNIRLINPYPFTHRFKTDPLFIGKTLLQLMCEKFPFQTEVVWKHRIELGLVYINHQAVPPNYLLSGLEEIFHYNPRAVEPAVPDEVEILVDEKEYLIVYKPAPMPMHPGGRYYKNTLSEILKDMGYKELRISHRLDAVTSGIVILAKSKEFAQKVTQCFTDGKVVKTYYALIDGIPTEKKITINAPIKRKHGFVFECGEHLVGAKKAVTHFEVEEVLESSTLIKCTPETGRTHQIRLHLAKWGYPIIDDLIYGRNGDPSTKTVQKRAISLVSAGLKIEELEVNYEFKNLSTNFKF